jgi:hypothetical protein
MATESQIQEFCSGCDLLKDDGSCQLDKVKSPATQALSAVIGGMLKDAVEHAAESQGIELGDGAKRDLAQRSAGYTDQERYVDRNSCGWASVDGLKGEMTKEGFLPSS